MVLFHILKALSICTLYASWKTGAPGWWRHLAEKQNIISPPYPATVWLWHKFIDLSTDTAAILNLLDFGSIMGCPWGTCSVFTHAFRAKKELQCIFLRKKAIIITFKQWHNNLFSHYNLFLGKLMKKLARKAQVYQIMLMPPGHPIILLKPNKFNMAAVLVKRSIAWFHV